MTAEAGDPFSYVCIGVFPDFALYNETKYFDQIIPHQSDLYKIYNLTITYKGTNATMTGSLYVPAMKISNVGIYVCETEMIFKVHPFYFLSALHFADSYYQFAYIKSKN